MSTEYYEKIFELSPIPIYILQDGFFKLVNASMARLSGYSAQELLQLPFFELIYPEDRSLVINNVRLRLSGEKVPENYEFRALDRWGNILSIQGVFSLLEYNGRSAVLGQIINITERKKAEEELRASEARYRDLVENLNDIIYTHDLEEGRLIAVNRAFALTMQADADKWVGRKLSDNLAPRVRHLFPQYMEMIRQKGQHRGIMCILDASGNERYLEYSSLVRYESQKPVVRGVARDVTRQIRFLKELRLIADFSRKFLATDNFEEELNNILFRIGHLLGADRVYCFRISGTGKSGTISDMHEWKAKRVKHHGGGLEGVTMSDLPWLMSEMEQGRSIFIADTAQLPGEALREREKLTALGIKSLMCFPVMAGMQLVGAIVVSSNYFANSWRDNDLHTLNSLAGLLGLAFHRKIAEEKVQYFADHDYLTGLPNRYFFDESLKQAVARARRGQKSALLLVDLDNFKLVNDNLGHAVGDELLINLAHLLKRYLREEDLLARLGGDEFVVLMRITGNEDAGQAAQRLRVAVEKDESCYSVRKYGFNLSMSIGAVIIDGTQDAQKLLSRADTALYAAKEGGKNRVVFLE